MSRKKVSSVLARPIPWWKAATPTRLPTTSWIHLSILRLRDKGMTNSCPSLKTISCCEWSIHSHGTCTPRNTPISNRVSARFIYNSVLNLWSYVTLERAELTSKSNTVVMIQHTHYPHPIGPHPLAAGDPKLKVQLKMQGPLTPSKRNPHTQQHSMADPGWFLTQLMQGSFKGYPIVCDKVSHTQKNNSGSTPLQA